MDPRNQADKVENLSRGPKVKYDKACVKPRTLVGNGIPSWTRKDFPLVKRITVGGCPIGSSVADMEIVAHAHTAGNQYQGICYPCGFNSNLAWNDKAPTATFLHEYAHLLCADFRANPEHAKGYPALKDIDKCKSHSEAWAMVYKDVLLNKYYPEFDGVVYENTGTPSDWRLAQPALRNPKPLPPDWQKMSRKEKDEWTLNARPIVHKALTPPRFNVELPKALKSFAKYEGEKRDKVINEYLKVKEYSNELSNNRNASAVISASNQEAYRQQMVLRAKSPKTVQEEQEPSVYGPGHNMTSDAFHKEVDQVMKGKDSDNYAAKDLIREVSEWHDDGRPSVVVKHRQELTSPASGDGWSDLRSDVRRLMRAGGNEYATANEDAYALMQEIIKWHTDKSKTATAARSITPKAQTTARNTPMSKSPRRRKSSTSDNPGKTENLTVRVGAKS